MAQINFKIDDEVYDVAYRFAQRAGVTVTEWARAAFVLDLGATVQRSSNIRRLEAEWQAFEQHARDDAEYIAEKLRDGWTQQPNGGWTKPVPPEWIAAREAFLANPTAAVLVVRS